MNQVESIALGAVAEYLRDREGRRAVCLAGLAYSDAPDFALAATKLSIAEELAAAAHEVARGMARHVTNCVDRGSGCDDVLAELLRAIQICRTNIQKEEKDKTQKFQRVPEVSEYGVSRSTLYTLDRQHV